MLVVGRLAARQYYADEAPARRIDLDIRPDPDIELLERIERRASVAFEPIGIQNYAPSLSIDRILRLLCAPGYL
jgi:hypothetical protein